MKYNKKFYDNIIKYNMLNQNDKIVIGCSGGADSMFLLYNLYLIKDIFNLNIEVCHINHGVRKTAKRDQDFVRIICKNLNLNFNTIDVNMNQFALENKMSSEEAGRYLRYQFFRTIGNKIFTAHNMDDQAETVLYRIVRGTGIDGLKSMSYINEDIYRPMLNISRREIEKYLLESGIEHVEDETNLMPIYTRNKIRLELIPYVEKNLNSNFKESLIKLQDLAEKQNLYFEKKINDYLKDNLYKNILNIKPLKDEDAYLTSLIIREYLKRLDLINGISKEQIENIVKLIRKDSSLITIHGIVFEVSQGYLNIKKDDKIINEITLTIGLNQTPFGVIKVEKGIKTGKNSIQIDNSKIVGNLKVRNKRTGDKFSPLGMQGSKKLKDFLIEQKIPKYLRSDIPIITDDKEIIWVAPYRMSENYKVNSKTDSIISIYLEEKNG